MVAALKPAGPKGPFAVGTLLKFNRDPLNFLLRCRREYGDIAYLNGFGLEIYLLNHPALIENVLISNYQNCTKDGRRRIGSIRQIFGNGLLTSEGEFWRHQRRQVQPAFHRELITAYGEAMVTCTEKMIANWQSVETRDIHQDMMKLTLEIMGKTIFTSDIPVETHDVGQAIDEIANYFSTQSVYLRPLGFLPTPGRVRCNRAIGRLNSIIYEIIRMRRDDPREHHDLLSLLMHAQDENGNRMSDQQLRDEVMTFFLAGHETTALALSWTWYLLAQHPEIESRLIDELKEVLNGRSPTIADLQRLRYTEMVVKESMRLYPPAWLLSREAKRDFEVYGYSIRKGAQVLMSQWVMHRDARYFDRPEEFRPERWADEHTKSLPRFAYFPFGGGPRVCIGTSYAMMEAILILATTAQRFHLTLALDQKVTPLPSITLRPKNGVKVIVTPGYAFEHEVCC
jgi:cytochrome P450